MTMTIGLYRIGADAELRYTQEGKPVCNLSLAFRYGREETGWISVTLWGDRATNVCPYLTKGKEIMAYISDVHIETFTNSQGVPSSKLEGTLTNFEFTSGSPKKETDNRTATAAPKVKAASSSKKKKMPLKTATDDDFL